MDELVTLIGGGGFVGRYAAQALMKTGARVRIAQRDPRQAFFIKTQGGLGQSQFVGVDIRRPDSVARAVAGAEVVVNLVGSFTDVQAIQADGAATVAEAAAAAGAKALVHVSAIGADPRSASAYGRSKGEGEARVRAAFPAATILRPSIVFGREDHFTNRFAQLIQRASVLPGRVVPILRAGTKFQPVFVGDVGDAIAIAAAHPGRFGGQTFELGGPEVITMGALQRWLADATGRSPRFVELPDAAGAALARVPFSPISWDQWLMLGRDNVAHEDGLAALGVTPTALETAAPEWLVRYRRQGRFSRRPLDIAA